MALDKDLLMKYFSSWLSEVSSGILTLNILKSEAFYNQGRFVRLSGPVSSNL